MHKAILFEKDEDQKTRCFLCRHGCVIKPGKRGICGVRENQGGELYTLVYDRLAASGVDPIEKKPFFHFLPGSLAFSIATMGCNFACSHCQNSHLSRTPADTGRIEGRAVTPDEIVASAKKSGCASMSYTYSEPTIYAELALDTAKIAKTQGIYNTYVTNGYQSPECLDAFDGLIDAANVDLKAWSKKFYKKVCHAERDGVLDTIRLLHARKVWIEITTLLIPGENDATGDLEALAAFIADVDPSIPWHISRYHPSYRMMNKPVTPVDSLIEACEIGRKAGLRYVYTGNVHGDERESTFCHACNARLIARHGYMIRENRIKEGKCPDCDAEVASVFDK